MVKLNVRMFLQKIPISILKEVAFVFLKLGILGFSGPAAHIAMMKEEVVERRKWLTKKEFLDLI